MSNNKERTVKAGSKMSVSTGDHDFPTAEVAKITHTKAPTPGDKGDTYSRWKNGTLADLAKLVKIGAADPKQNQNSSPTIQEFLDELQPYKGKVKLIGYVIYPPRGDARISVDGFTANSITADEALDLTTKYGSADENSTEQNDDKTYNVLFWWD
jgi:hypothetical protein